MYHLSPSILAADFARLGQQIEEVVNAGADYLHVDVMDGKFVPSISFGMPVIKSIRKVSDVFFDVHLMIEEPIRYIKEFKESGADLITVHVEACSNVKDTLDAIKAEGLKAGLALNPETPVSEVFPYLKDVDMVLVMSVHPGFGGQKFIEETLEKMSEIRKKLDEVNPTCDLEADGGINLSNVKCVTEHGVNVIVAGTAIFKGVIEENVKKFREVGTNDSHTGKGGCAD